MNSALRQRGQLIVAGIVLIVVVALMISTLGYLYVSNQGSSVLHGSSGTAYYAARSGIEAATQQFTVNATACAGLTAGAQAVGTNASFTIAATAFNVSPPTANNTTVTAIQTFIPIGAGAIGSYAPSGRVRIETEEIDYSAQSSDSATCGGSPPCLVVSKRGAAGTTAAAHAVQPVYQNLCSIRSTGTSGNATRIVDRALHDAASMMVYAKIGSGVANADYPRPFYRFWTGAAWGAEQTNANNFGLTGVGTTIRWTVLKMARTRNEAMLATVHDDGSIRLQIWNGFYWFVPAALGAGGQLTTALGADDGFRGVDIAYETATDRVLIVYNNGTQNPQFRIWDGSTLSGATGVNTSLGIANYPSNTAGARSRWIRLASNPLSASNEIAMITLNSSQDVAAVRWTGTLFASMEVGAPSVWDGTASDANTREAVTAAYEQVSGRAMFMWARSTTGNTGYLIWNGTQLVNAAGAATAPAAAPNLNIAAQSTLGQWVKLVSQANSNSLLFGVQSSTPDLDTRYWNGSAWDTVAQHPEHDTAVEQATNRVFDLAFETHQSQIGNAWLVWGNGAVVGARKFTLSSCGGSCWGAITTRGDDTSRIDVEAHPQSGAIFALIYESSSATNPEEVLEMRLTGGAAAWSGLTQIWPGRNDTNNVTDGRLHGVMRRHITTITQEFFPP
jgi:hypothetical protein